MNHPIQNLPTDLPTDRHYPRNRIVSAGFTIVELLIVIVVIGILAAMTLVAYNGIQQKARDGGVMTDLHGLGFLETQYALLNNAPGKDWYSGNGIDSSLNFTPSPGNVIDVMTNGTDYCIRAYNPGSASYKTLDTAATRESAPGACSVIVASVAATTAADATISGWSKIAVATSARTCAIATNGQAYCWGTNAYLDSTYGALGNNSYINTKVPVAVDTSGVLSGKTVLAIASGSSHTCAIASDGKAYCWGLNSVNQLGNNTGVNTKVPVAVDTSGALSGKTLVAISAAGNTTCVVASDNYAYCWGANRVGQMGYGVSVNTTVPMRVFDLGLMSGKTVKTISVGVSETICVIASDNNSYCAGNNNNVQVGDNMVSSTNPKYPAATSTSGVLNGKNLIAISVGWSHACAIASDGQVYCWGAVGSGYSFGQLGNSPTAYGNFPVTVYTGGGLSGKTVTAITTSYNTCAITSAQEAYCWGYNSDGNLGNNSTVNALVPTAVDTSGVLNGKKITVISSAGHNTCAVTADKQAYCWGANDYGQLGNNSTTNSLVPVTVMPPPTP